MRSDLIKGARLSRPTLIAVWLYSVLMAFIVGIARRVAAHKPAVARFLAGRELRPAQVAWIREQRDPMPYSVLFYCSSAGEYEQAKPLIDRLTARGDVYCQILFFSESGLAFAKARGETTPFAKAPIDTIWHWRQLFAIIRPNAVMVVRHELWPAFLAAARESAFLHLINATYSPSLEKASLARWFKGRLLRSFDRIDTVSEDDRKFYIGSLGAPEQRVYASGDTKYDRVRERAATFDQLSRRMTERLDVALGSARRLIVGSAWHRDVELAVGAYQRLEGRADWQLILAPHDTGEEMVGWIEAYCRDAGLATVRMSSISTEPLADGDSGAVLVVDKMGILAELYGCCELAMVGGALHHKVHNVLEPACRGLYLCFGPCYKNSQEADLLVREGLADVVSNTVELWTWWQARHLAPEGRHARLLAKVDELCGAADRLMAVLVDDGLQSELQSPWQNS